MLQHYIAAVNTQASPLAKLILVIAMGRSGSAPIVPTDTGFRTSLGIGVSDFERALGELAWRGYLASTLIDETPVLWFTYHGGPMPFFRKAPLRSTLSEHVRAAVFDRDGAACVYCKTTEGPFHIDHIKAVIKGGSDEIENLCVACEFCNLSKGAKDLEDWNGGIHA